MIEQEYMDRTAEEAMKLLASELERRLKEPVAVAVSDRLETTGLSQSIEQLQRAVKTEMAGNVQDLRRSLEEVTDRLDQGAASAARAAQVETLSRDVAALRDQVAAIQGRLGEIETRQSTQAARLEAGLAVILSEIGLLQRADKVIVETLRQFLAPAGNRDAEA
jgi:Fe2+ transport system protein B